MELELMESLNRMQGQQETDWLQFGFIMGTAIVFGVLLKLLYTLYFRENEPQDFSLARGLILITPALTATFWMIQSSLVLSLGLLGTLSFVRFRTPVKRAEDVAFIIVALAVSVALAIGAIPVALILVGCLFIYTGIRNLPVLPMGRKKSAVITFNTKKSISSEDIMMALKALDIKSEFVSARTYDGITSYVFNASRIAGKNRDGITDKLNDLDGQSQINVFFPDQRLGT